MTDTALPFVDAELIAAEPIETTRREALRLDDWFKVGAAATGVAALHGYATLTLATRCRRAVHACAKPTTSIEVAAR